MAIDSLLVSPTRVYLEAMAPVLERDPRIHVVATAMSGEDAIAAVRRHAPRVVLLELPVPEGLITARALLAHGEVRVVAFGVPTDEHEVLAWAACGVAGCIVRDGSVAELVDAIVQAARGLTVCSPCLAGVLFRRAAAVGPPRTFPEASDQPPLTSREIEILELVAQGLSNKQIARMLRLQVPTVKNHVRHIFQKLGIHRRSETLAWADLLVSRVPLPRAAGEARGTSTS